jgi:hypothetical protein
MAYPKYSTIVKVAISDSAVTATTYTTKSSAETAYAGFVNGGLYSEVYLHLEALPSKSFEKPTWSGTYIDSYGVTRVIGTNEEYVP